MAARRIIRKMTTSRRIRTMAPRKRRRRKRRRRRRSESRRSDLG
jgi:hypothetical protein